jgi:hypothetical protein
MTQQAVAAELGVTTRTLRNWKAAPAQAASPAGSPTVWLRDRRSKRERRKAASTKLKRSTIRSPSI